MGQSSGKMESAAKDTTRTAEKPDFSRFYDNVYNYTNPVNWTSNLLGQPVDTLDIILSYLDAEELLNVSCTCKAMHTTIMRFIKHECSARNLENHLQDFKKTNEGLLTVQEQAMDRIADEDPLDQAAPAEELSSKERRRLWWLFKRKKYFDMKTLRISIADADRVGFAHRGTGYIPVEEDEELGREICNLLEVCWLHFDATFENVPPGLYAASVVLKVKRGCRMPHSDNQKTEWIVTGAETNPRTGKQFWKELAMGRTPSAELCDGLSIHVVDNKKDSENWIAIQLPPVRISGAEAVNVAMKDIECPWWKSGIRFDFVQLKKISD